MSHRTPYAKLNLTSDEIFERREEQERAQAKIAYALRKGTLIRPKSCELCGDTPEEMTVSPYRDKGETGYKIPHTRSAIFAHHHTGYGENSLKVWWVCASCNNKMHGLEFHDGSLTIEQAREIIKQRRLESQWVTAKMRRDSDSPNWRYLRTLITL